MNGTVNGRTWAEIEAQSAWLLSLQRADFERRMAR